MFSLSIKKPKFMSKKNNLVLLVLTGLSVVVLLLMTAFRLMVALMEEHLPQRFIFTI